MNASRKPLETKLPRMSALARLPVFLALDGKRAVLAGGSPAAAWKAELLSACGAHVDVYAVDPCDELLQLATDPPRGTIAIDRRDWTAEDLKGAVVAVGAFEDDEVVVIGDEPVNTINDRRRPRLLCREAKESSSPCRSRARLAYSPCASR